MATPHLIGIIGCGRMGLGMARNLAAKGFDVLGHDIKPLSEFGDFAAHMRHDAGSFAADRTVLISVLRDAAETDTALFGAQNLIVQAPALKTLIISSTLSPDYIHALRAKLPNSIALVDAPMSGAQIKADNGTLSFMLGGAEDLITPLMPAFQAMGTQCHYLGPLGSGMTAKVLNNLVAASSMVATRTALDWAVAQGLAPEALLAVMHTSSGQNWLASGFESIEFARHGYDKANSIGILAKDVECALSAAPEGANTDLAQILMAQLKSMKPYNGH